MYTSASTRENLILFQSNNKGADHPAHPHSPINTNAVHSLKSITAELASCEIPIFQLVFVVQQARLKPSLVTTPEDEANIVRTSFVLFACCAI